MATLTQRQIEIARLLMDSKSYQEIALELGVTKDTVKSHAEAIYKRLEVDSAVALTRDYHMQLAEKKVGSLTGYWLSRFEFKSRTLSTKDGEYSYGSQINLEHVTGFDDSYFTHKGVSLCSSPSSKLTFTHQFRFKQENNVLVGIWENTNTRNIGCMQLVIRNDGMGMHGQHLGTTSDLSVASGNWAWRKVQSNGSVVKPGATNFRPIDELEAFFSSSSDPRIVVTLQQLFSEK